MNAEPFPQKLWRWFVSPSAEVVGADKRRQAALLSVILLGMILLAVVVESVTVALISWDDYTGYRQTSVGVVFLTVIYCISRTRYVRLAATLSVITASAITFYTGWAQPKGVLGGLFDFLIVPLWLGSLYLNAKELSVLIVVNLLGLLFFPQFTSSVSFTEVVVGPFSFLVITSILLVIITQYRNLLEQDRRNELTDKEAQSRREAERAGALLRVAGRLNAQLDLDALLGAISEEVSLALHTQASMVMLYDPKRDALNPVSGTGLPVEKIKKRMPVPGPVYRQTLDHRGMAFSVHDLQLSNGQAYLEPFKDLQIRSMASAAMMYEHELIGGLTAITLGETHPFTEDELLLLRGLADQAALAINNTRLYKDAHRRLERLQALRAIDIAISSNRDLQETLEVVLDQITQQLHVDAAVILLLDEGKQTLEFGTCRGFQTSTLRYTSLHVGEGMAGRAAQHGHIVHVKDLRNDPQTLANAPALAREGFISYYAAPLLSQGQVSGVLEVFHRSLLDPDPEWLGFLETLAGQAAIAIENTTLFEDLQRTNGELMQAYNATIEGWSHALDLRDHETEGHTQRVTEMTLELAKFFGFRERELIFIRWGSLLHDIGKMGIPDQILLKEGPLTESEWEIMRQHPVYAHEMLRTIQYLRPALDIPYCHHEKWNGTGYPRQLKGEEIPLTARIFAVADVWDALTSDRPYRAAWSREKTLEHIQQGAGTHFDPYVVQIFTDWLCSQSNI